MDEMVPKGQEEAGDIPDSSEDLAAMFKWLSLSAAHKFLGRFKTLLEPQEPLEALLSALRSGLVSAQCDDSVPLAKHPGLKMHGMRKLAPREWAEATQLNLWDNAINLRDGSLATDIEVSKYELYNWLSQRTLSEPDFAFDDFEAFAKESGIVVEVSKDGGVKSVTQKRTRQSRGGPKLDASWPDVLIYFMAHALIGAPSVVPTTSKKEISRQILASAATHFPDFEKSLDHVRRAYATTVQEAVASAYALKQKPAPARRPGGATTS